MTLRGAVAITLIALVSGYSYGHCQIPCGIYGDAGRFDTLDEHARTISKSMTEIATLSDGSNANQLTRWIDNKETHAQYIQDIIGEYFLAQRIKSSQPDYVERLKLAHSIIVNAMKTKQTVDLANAEALSTSIQAFRNLYFGIEKAENK